MVEPSAMFQGTSYCCTRKNRQSFFGENVSSHTADGRPGVFSSLPLGLESGESAQSGLRSNQSYHQSLQFMPLSDVAT